VIIKNLQYLAALAREKHFARAAAACGVTQPTLSAGIKQLEEELGLLLVQRGQRFEGLTAEGARIFEWAVRVLADYESLHQEASELRAGLSGRLTIGVVPTALPIVAGLTTPFAKAHPKVTLSVFSHSSQEIQRGLDDFSLDAGITYLDNEPLANVRGIPLYRERYFLFTSRANPLATREVIAWAEAARQSLCLLTPNMQNRRIVDGLFAAAGVSPSPTVETNSVLALWAHLQNGHWSSILPQAFLHLFGIPAEVAVIPLESRTDGPTIGVAVPDREPLTPSARELAALAGTLEFEKVFANLPR
jgi:DNA-binding transcriptional LysR family regulator